jgi:hypothetical protein
MRAASFIALGARHFTGVALQALLIAAIVAALAFAVASVTGSGPAGANGTFAGRAKTASIELSSVNGRLASSVQPTLGDTVYFDVVVPSNVNNPRVEVMCYQSGDVVYGETGSVGQATGDGTDSLGYSGFLLGGGGSLWKDNGGAADCVAKLFYFGQKAGKQTFNVLDTTNFSAGA